MTNTAAESRARLRTKVDELVTQTLVGEDSAEATASLLTALSRIASEADAAGLSQISGLSLGLHSNLEQIAPFCSSDTVLAGLTSLQNALETPATSADSAQSLPSPEPERPEATNNSIASDPELLSDFLVESRDHLANIEQQLLALERDPRDPDAMSSAFRSFHTIKGLAGFLELPVTRDVAHEVETLLDLARNGKLSITPAVVDVVLEGADFLKNETNRVSRQLAGQFPGESLPLAPFIAKVHFAISGEGPAPAVNRPVHKPASTPEKADLPSPSAETPPEAMALSLIPLEAEPSAPPPVERDSTLTAEPEAKATAANKANGGTSETRFVKVDTSKLDFLVDMVGELVIAQSLVQHDGDLKTVNNPKLVRNLSQLSRITGEVQKTAMSMRMVPVGQLFQRSARLVRDLTRKAGKRADLDIAGEDTELDRTIVEELSDPLMHMIRNSADHGIEPPEERIRSGKNPTARIGLKAYHQAGHIVIEVSDDGRGLDRTRILKKAIEKGLIQDGAHLSDKEVFNLIFEPGFSTAEKITDISGRGVGMDVVRRNIQKMRGRIEIDSRLGHGTTFYLKLPLTLAIIDGLVIGVGQQRYIVPIYAVREIFRPRTESVFTVEGRREMLLVRGTLHPVVRLHQRFRVTPRSTDLCESVVVVAETAGKRFCLAVDELIGKQEVVIKSLGDQFKQVCGLAGGAILGDGRVGLILDIEGLHGEAAHA